MSGRRYRTEDPKAGNKSVMLDIQVWLDGVPGDDAGWGAIIYREDVRTIGDLEAAIDDAFKRLKAKAFLAMR